MRSPAARIVLVVIGAIAVVVGAVFSGQGLGLIPGSFMTGDRTWLLVGLILVVVGIVLVVNGLRRPKRARGR